MAYNYEETDIINEMIDLYDNTNKNDSINNIYNTLTEILYNLVIYNDSENILEIIELYGGFNYIFMLYETIYKYPLSNILEIDKSDQLNYNNLIAFIGMFHHLYTKIINLINIDELCNDLSIL
jgi:hypothetical protein